MAKHQRKKESAPKQKVSVRISKELREKPMPYSGPLGFFGLGGEIERQPLVTRAGYPPVNREPIPEATIEQYIAIAKEGVHASKHIQIINTKADTSEGS